MERKLDKKEVDIIHRDLSLLKKEISKVVVGQENVVNGLLKALLADGHVLVEGVPGIAKTLIIRTLAHVTTSNFQRVQFTSDLLPTDILGLTAYDKDKGFYVVRGPIFANFLLADEINRAPGKCVTSDTDIMLGNGELMSIKDVFNRYNGKKTYKRGNESWIIPKEDFYVPSFNLDTYKIEPKKVKYLFKQKVREPYYEIDLATGRQIKTSKVHPFFSLINGDIKNINAENLENGSCVLVPKRINIKGDNSLEYDKDLIRINENVKNEIRRRKKLFLKVRKLKYLQPKQVINKLKIKNKNDGNLVRTYLRFKPKYLNYKLKDAFFINAKQFGQIKLIKMPKSVDKKLARFMAFLIAESYHKSNGDIFISMKDKKMIMEFKNILKDIFGYKVRILRDKRNDLYRLAISSKTLTALLTAIGYKINAHSGDKQIPNFILKADNNIIKEFLKVYFECDGWVNRDCVSVTTKSKDIANKIAYLLLREGIVARIRKAYKKTNVGEGYFYTIDLYGKSLIEFNKEVRFFSKEKNKKLEIVCKGITNKFTDFIPDFHNYLKDLRKKLNLTHKEFHKLTGLYAFQLEYLKNRRRHSRAILNKVYNGIKNVGDVSHLKKLIDGDFYCDFVKKIKIVRPKKDYYLYDFTIDDTHSFIAGFGGVISHNTQSALLEAMQEKQVTIGRETFSLEKPFFVLATQNPIETIASLTLDQDVFINGRLIKGQDLLELVKRDGEKLHSMENGAIYNLKDAWTYSLDESNKLKKTSCMPYFVDYEGVVYDIKTRSGRKISVNPGHPFLINENGELKWEICENLKKSDFLVAPRTLPKIEEELKFPKHDVVISSLKNNFNVVSCTDIKELKNKTRNFTYFDKLANSDFNKLRILLKLSKKDIWKKLYKYKKEYYSLVRFFSRNTKNKKIRRDLIEFLKEREFKIEEKDFIESDKIVAINNFDIDEDIMFWIAFVLSDGWIGNNCIGVSQKNYPQALERFIAVTKSKIGLERIFIRERNGCREAVIRSKPFVDYIKKRLLIEGHIIPQKYLGLKAELRREFLKTFISLEGYINKSRLTFVQKNPINVNILSYLLLFEGLRFNIQRRKNDIYNLETRDLSELGKYLEQIGWISELNFKINNRRIVNCLKRVKLNINKLNSLFSLLGLHTFHTARNRYNISEKSWYNAYRYLKKNGIMSEESFVNMVKDIEKRFLEANDVNSNFHDLATFSGLSITDIANNVGCSKDSVWQFYNDNSSKDFFGVGSYIKNESLKRMEQAGGLINEFKILASDEIFYDEIIEMTKRMYKGKLFGLSVPIYHSYIGGFGACGINHNTYPLPEAQIDRFLFKLYMGYPNKKEEQDILKQNMTTKGFEDYNLRGMVSSKEIIKMQDMCKRVFVNEDVEKYIIRLTDATRYSDKYKLKLGRFIAWGSSPRASIGLYIGAKAEALLNGKTFVTPQHVKDVAHDVLRHRLILNYEGQAEGIKTDDIITEILAKVPTP